MWSMRSSQSSEDAEPVDRSSWTGRPPAEAGSPPVTAAFLLTQLGAHAAERFAQRISSLGLTPPQAGLLRAIALGPGQSQQALARRLRTQPSRVVAMVDELEDRGLVERARNPRDRRLHALNLTASGRELLQQVGQAAIRHDQSICEPLGDEERQQLATLLERLRIHHGLSAGVHPGFRHIGRAEPKSCSGGDQAGRVDHRRGAD